MTKHRFFCDRLTVGRVVLAPGESRHAVQVLRLREETVVELFDGCGRTAIGRIVEPSRSGLAIHVEDVVEVPRPGGPPLTLVTAMPRTHRQHILFEKCTELGVARIVPTLFQRSTVKPKADSVSKWQRTVLEAAKQAGCLYLPHIGKPATFAETLTAAIVDADVRLIGATGGKCERLGGIIGEWSDAGSVAVWIGPEGGMTEEELVALEAVGAIPISLGPYVLRIETAAIAVAAAFAAMG